MRSAPLLALLAVGCVPVEPLDLPADPAARGVPVGVRTFALDETTVEVWYPARDEVAGEPTDVVDFNVFFPDSFVEAVGAFDLPRLDSGAVRDAPVRHLEAPVPILLFSHGMAGMRVQSLDYAVHLASRGYVVVAPDQPGRMLGDYVTCLVTPPLEGCQLDVLLAGDPAPPHIEAATAWVEVEAEDGFLLGLADPERMALTGHSMGALTVGTMGNADPRWDALLGMANGPVIERDVPTLVMGGTCDGVVHFDEIETAFAGTPDGHLVGITDAGHLAFSDICSLDLNEPATALLADDPDLVEYLFDRLMLQASDGCDTRPPDDDLGTCGEAYMDLDVAFPIIRHYATVFLDEALKGEGPGVEDGVFEGVTVEGSR